MIETQTCKDQQLTNGFFQSGSGREVVLLLGSCRTLHYINYLSVWNATHGNRFTVCRIDPHDFHWNKTNEIVDLESVIRSCETDERILGLLRRTSIFIHEYFRYYRMFNTDQNAETNIYQFGLKPRLDICIPNFHDKFVLFQEQVDFDPDVQAELKQSGMNAGLSEKLKHRGLSQLDKFYDICRLSSFPHFAEEFRSTWQNVRYFSTGNHVNRNFTLAIWRRMNEQYLNLPTDLPFNQTIEAMNLFATPATPVTQYDVDAYQLNWGCPIETLKIK